MNKAVMHIDEGWFPGAVSYRYEVDFFNIKQIAESGQAFRFYELAERPGFLHYYNVSGDKYVEILQRDNCIELLTKPEWVAYWEEYLGLKDDNLYEELFKKISKSGDEPLINGMKLARGVRVLHQDGWETTISFMLSAANSVHNISLYLSRFCKCFGDFKIYKIGEYEVSYWTFPSYKAVKDKVTEETLRQLGFGFRAKNISKFILSMPENFDFSNEKSLLSVTGIGDKIKDCILLYSNKELDRIPMDVWMKRAADTLYNGQFPWEDFKPHRGICQIYLYYYCRHATL